MDIPHRGARPALAPPEILVQDSNPSDRFRNASRPRSYVPTSSNTSVPMPMSIPNARDPVPPPLPPPRHLADIADGGSNGRDIAWQWGNCQEDGEWGRHTPSVAPGSSLYGSFASRKSITSDRPDYDRRSSSTSTVTSMLEADTRERTYPRLDEGYASLSGTSVASDKSVLRLFLAL